MRKLAFLVAMAFTVAGNASAASVHTSTQEEIAAGCPAQIQLLPTNTNAVVLDNSISTACWVAINGEKGGGRGKGDTGQDD